MTKRALYKCKRCQGDFLPGYLEEGTDRNPNYEGESLCYECYNETYSLWLTSDDGSVVPPLEERQRRVDEVLALLDRLDPQDYSI